MARILDPADIATAFRAEISARVAALSTPLTLVGLLASDAGPSETYSRYTEVGCHDVGIRFDRRKVDRFELEREIDRANADPAVHGIMIYYPVFGVEQDNYLKDLVAPEKDVEGLGAHWLRNLYHNERFVDETRSKKSILPCTPLAIVKLLDAAGVFAAGTDVPLSGKTITVFNRSEVVGRPLAAMLAHDGARVFSFDVNGVLAYGPDGPRETHITRTQALALSDVVVTGVPSREFPLVRADEIKAGSVCINFSTLRNFDESVKDKASVFIPRVGPMTVTMALRNTVRLFDNFHAPS